MQEGRVPQASDARGLTARSLRVAGESAAAGLRAEFAEPWRALTQVNHSACWRRTIGSMNRWEHFEHGADIGVRGFGASVAEAFEQAALALTAVIADPAGVR